MRQQKEEEKQLPIDYAVAQTGFNIYELLYGNRSSKILAGTEELYTRVQTHTNTHIDFCMRTDKIKRKGILYLRRRGQLEKPKSDRSGISGESPIHTHSNGFQRIPCLGP